MDEEKRKKSGKSISGIILVLLVLVSLVVCGVVLLVKLKPWEKIAQNTQNEEQLKELPKPEITGGDRGKLGIDKNINEENIDEYLNRPDAVYRDMRMLEDPANYEAVGGDSKLSGYVKGFEVVSLPYIIPISGLPSEVGKTYSGKTLFYKDENENYQPNYEESVAIIENLFPKDKVIFLMCGGGGYAGMMRQFLISQGWNENKIYNVGGYWYYDGKNNVEVKKIVDGKVTYDFDSVPYHEIKFDELTYKVKSKKVTLDSKFYGMKEDNYYDVEYAFDKALGYNGNDPVEAKKATDYMNLAIEKKVEYIENYIKNEASFIVIVFNEEGVCMERHDDSDFEELAISANTQLDELNVYAYRMNLPTFKKTSFYKTVKYAPSIVVFDKGEIAAYTDANVDSFSNDKEVMTWLQKYVNLKKE